MGASQTRRRLSMSSAEREKQALLDVEQGSRRRPRRASRRIAVIIAMVALMTMYWMYGLARKTSTEAVKVSEHTRPRTVIEIDTNPSPSLPPDEPGRYLGYYPHGGFHTQRIALENALTLCRLLDRTLLLPPLWVGQHPPWHSAPALRYGLNNSSKASLQHCRHTTPLPVECEGHEKWTQVSWDWMVDLEMADVAWVDRWDLSDTWLSTPVDDGGLGIQGEEDVYRVIEDKKYGVQITDTDAEPSAQHPYEEALSLDSLLELEHPLIHFDSLAGSARLLLESEEAIGAKHEVQSSMVIANPPILGTAQMIIKLLGPNYVAADARVHGRFELDAGNNMRAAWWELGRRLGVHDDVLEKAEKEVWARSPGWRKSVTGFASGDSASYPAPPARPMDSVLEEARTERPPKDAKLMLVKGSNELVCPRLKHTANAKSALNTPLFLTTSADDPRSQPALRLFYSTYPCLYTLHTPEVAAMLEEAIPDGTVNKLDGYDLSPWLREWVGWEVAARGQELVGTNGSAWGKWAEEMVQPIANDWPIVFRD